MKIQSILAAALLALASCASVAQQPSKWQLGSTYFAYPQPSSKADSIIAEARDAGLKPIYVSHYGRHGSRWLTSDERYKRLTASFDSLNAAGLLTPLGMETRDKLHSVSDAAMGHGGELTPKGEAQHRAIAKRMAERVPEVFAPEAKVIAQSSTRMRCAMSMANFLLKLASMQPTLQITANAYPANMAFISFTTPEAKEWGSEGATWRDAYKAYVDSCIDPTRFVSALVNRPEALPRPIQAALMIELYWLAEAEQNAPAPASVIDLFTYDELQSVWRVINARMYMCNANPLASGGAAAHSADALLAHIIESADAAIAAGEPAANLRFGHDTDLLRLLARMGIDRAAGKTDAFEQIENIWRDYDLTPMAANLQLVFFQGPGGGEPSVLCLLNEEPAAVCGRTGLVPWSELKSLMLSEK